MMNKFKNLITFTLTLAVLCGSILLSAAAQKTLFTEVPAEGTVYFVPQFSDFKEISSQDMLFLKKTLRRAEKNKVKAVIFEMDTPGGRIDVALEYVSMLLKSKVPTVAYLNPQGISAGMIIALAADRIAINPNGVIGDAMPIQIRPDGIKPVTEKDKAEKDKPEKDNKDKKTDKDKQDDLYTLKERRDACVDLLNEIPGVRCFRPEATFYAFPNVTGLMKAKGLSTYDELRRSALEQTGVSFCTRLHFGRALPGEAESYARFAYSGIPVAEIREGLGKLKEWAQI